MFAIIRSGGKQYKVTGNALILVEKLPHAAGDKIKLEEVLLVNHGTNLSLGAPLVKDAHVEAHVVEQTRDKKVIIFKKKRRQNYRRKKGHRQEKTVLRITDIVVGGKSILPADFKANLKNTSAKKEGADKKVSEVKPAVKTTEVKPAAKTTSEASAPKTEAKKPEGAKTPPKTTDKKPAPKKSPAKKDGENK